MKTKKRERIGEKFEAKFAGTISEEPGGSVAGGSHEFHRRRGLPDFRGNGGFPVRRKRSGVSPDRPWCARRANESVGAGPGPSADGVRPQVFRAAAPAPSKMAVRRRQIFGAQLSS